MKKRTTLSLPSLSASHFLFLSAVLKQKLSEVWKWDRTSTERGLDVSIGVSL
jgi:hypothetical protein